MKNFLTPAQIKELNLAHKQERNQRFADRIKAILGVNAGLTPVHVLAQYLLVDERTIWRYVMLYTRGGLERLLERKHSGSAGKLTQQELEELDTWIEEKTPRSTKQVQAFVDQQFQVEMSRSALTQILKRRGFAFIKPQTRPGRADQAQQDAFCQMYERLKKTLESMIGSTLGMLRILCTMPQPRMDGCAKASPKCLKPTTVVRE